MKLKYIPVFTQDMDGQLNFYTQKLGFKMAGNMWFMDGEQSTVVQAKNLDVALVVTPQHHGADYKTCVLLSTDDCLNDYHRYKALGVFFCTAPRYLPTGLAAEFLDPDGNRFVLLEERSYTE
jgi:predicted enzyme related to lactoylglutathione lyase